MKMIRCVPFVQLWIVIGTVLILIVASRDVKITFFLAFSAFVLFYINGIGLNDYWLIAMIGLVILGYLIGLGKGEEAGAGMADPYASLLGGGGGY